jgi:hypothetical protein
MKPTIKINNFREKNTRKRLKREEDRRTKERNRALEKNRRQ